MRMGPEIGVASPNLPLCGVVRCQQLNCLNKLNREIKKCPPQFKDYTDSTSQSKDGTIATAWGSQNVVKGGNRRVAYR